MTDLSRFFKKSIGLLDCLEVFCCCWTLPEVDPPVDPPDVDWEEEDDEGAVVEVEFEVGADAAELPDVVFAGFVGEDELVLLFAPEDVLLEGAEADEFVLFAWANELPIVPINTERTDANAIITSACLFKFIEIYYCKVIFKIYI